MIAARRRTTLSSIVSFFSYLSPSQPRRCAHRNARRRREKKRTYATHHDGRGGVERHVAIPSWSHRRHVKRGLRRRRRRRWRQGWGQRRRRWCSCRCCARRRRRWHRRRSCARQHRHCRRTLCWDGCGRDGGGTCSGRRDRRRAARLPCRRFTRRACGGVRSLFALLVCICSPAFDCRGGQDESARMVASRRDLRRPRAAQQHCGG